MGLSQSPPCWAGVSTLLKRTCEPPSHILLHVDHLVHGASSQSILHFAILQLASSLVAPHGSPPCLASTSTLRSRSMTPPPHGALHELQPVHSPIWQFTGQSSSPHFSTISKPGHSAPPFCGGVRTLRVKVWVPPPHVEVHALLSHFETTQST